MQIQEQAFRAYYASMTDSELLATVKNRSSFIPLAQSLLAEELLRRQLTPPVDAPAETKPSPGLFTKMRRMLRRETSEHSDSPKAAEDRIGTPEKQDTRIEDSDGTSRGG
jgi:hypothetical protein